MGARTKITTFILEPSQRRTKKWQVTNNETGQTIHFGAAGYSDYTVHKDVARKVRYIARHSRKINGKSVENWGKSGISTAGFWARWILWNKPSLQASIRDTQAKFGIKIVTAKNKR